MLVPRDSVIKSLKGVSSPKVTSLMVAVTLFAITFYCQNNRKGEKVKGFPSYNSLFLTQKSENQKLFKKSQQGDCMSLWVTGTVSRNIAGRQVGTGYLSQGGHIYSLVTLVHVFQILCVCGHSQVIVAGVIHHVLLCALLFCSMCLTLLARQRKPVSVPRHRSPVQMGHNLSNQSFTHGHSGRSFCLFLNRKKNDSSVYLEMFTFEFSCFVKLLMYLKLTVISFSWVLLSELK